MHDAHCIHWLMSTGLLSHRAFYQPCKFTTRKMVPMDGSKSVVGNCYCYHCQYYVTGFMKTDPNCTKTEIHFIA